MTEETITTLEEVKAELRREGAIEELKSLHALLVKTDPGIAQFHLVRSFVAHRLKKLESAK